MTEPVRRYRARPIKIDARQWLPGTNPEAELAAMRDWLGEDYRGNTTEPGVGPRLFFTYKRPADPRAPQQIASVGPGDWVARDEEGFYPAPGETFDTRWALDDDVPERLLAADRTTTRSTLGPRPINQ